MWLRLFVPGRAEIVQSMGSFRLRSHGETLLRLPCTGRRPCGGAPRGADLHDVRSARDRRLPARGEGAVDPVGGAPPAPTTTPAFARAGAARRRRRGLRSQMERRPPSTAERPQARWADGRAPRSWSRAGRAGTRRVQRRPRRPQRGARRPAPSRRDCADARRRARAAPGTRDAKSVSGGGEARKAGPAAAMPAWPRARREGAEAPGNRRRARPRRGRPRAQGPTTPAAERCARSPRARGARRRTHRWAERSGPIGAGSCQRFSPIPARAQPWKSDPGGRMPRRPELHTTSRPSNVGGFPFVIDALEARGDRRVLDVDADVTGREHRA